MPLDGPSAVRFRHMSAPTMRGSASFPASAPVLRPNAHHEAVSYTDCVIAMVHALRESAPLCVPQTSDLASPQMLHDEAVYLQQQTPVSDSDLPTTERLTNVQRFQLSEGITVSSIAPAIFARIMCWCGVTMDEFLADWCATFGTVSSAPSRGKSASAFVTSASGRFLMKTINLEEFTSLHVMLPSYYAHLLDNPNSLLPRHFGAFSVKRTRVHDQKWFTIMPNIVHHTGGVLRVYDLKGSTYHRAASERDAAASPPLLKDNDLLQRRERFTVTSVARKMLLAQLEADVAWLASTNRMDYSLLVGVCGADQARWKPCGYTVLHDSAAAPIVCAGIIDILQDYNLKKQVAHTLKTTVGAPEQELSTVPAASYGKRFLAFMSSSLFEKERDAYINFFLDPEQTAASQRSALHRDDAIAAGDVVGRTHNEVLTLDVMSPNVRSLVVVSEVRLPATTHRAETQRPGSPEVAPEDGTRFPSEPAEAREEDNMLLYTCKSGSDVPVNVVGPVSRGDMLVPSGRSDGTAVAVPQGCAAPAYVFGVVESVPTRMHHPSTAATKYTVVRATVSAHCIVDEKIPWMKLVLSDTHSGLGSQAMWVAANDDEAVALTRSCALNPTGLSYVKMYEMWLTIDWLAGEMTKDTEVIPIRCDSNIVMESVSRHIAQRRHKAASNVQAFSGAKPRLDNSLLMSSFSMPSAAEVPLGQLTPRSSVVVKRAETSLGGWIRNWLFRRNTSSFSHFAEIARDHYRANQTCASSALVKGPGVLKRVLSYLAIPDLGSVARVCRQWHQHSLSQDLWEALLQLYSIPVGDVGSITVHAKQRYQHARRSHLLKSEKWNEDFGLRYPLYGAGRQRLLKCAGELDLYDMAFQRVGPPHRIIVDFALFKRERSHCAPSAEVWEVDKAFPSLWPNLRRQYLRSLFTLRFETTAPEHSSATERLAFLRINVIEWLGPIRYELRWEEGGLLVTLESRNDMEYVLERYRKGEGLAFAVSYYSTMQWGKEVFTWDVAKRRLWAACPGTGASSFRPAAQAPPPLSASVFEEYSRTSADAASLRTTLADVFEEHLFPGHCGVALHNPPTPPDADQKSLEVYEIRDSDKVPIPGQVFPVLFATSHAVVAVVEVNSALPVLSEDEARAHPLGHLLIQGHGGLEPYVLCSMDQVRCDREPLARLMTAVDIIMSGHATASASYTVAVEGQRMQDSDTYSLPPLWTCPALQHKRDEILEVLTGQATTMDVLDPCVQEDLHACMQTDITAYQQPRGPPVN